MDEAKLRAWWSHKQALDGRLRGQTAASILEKTGWARSVGGVAPYLTLFSRGSVGREAADQAVASLDIHELPAVRGCTYVVPAGDFALALKAGQNFTGNDMKTASKLGVTNGQIDKLCAAVLEALGAQAMDPEQLREATGSASRSLGEEGKKKGLTTTLPLALGRLQSGGDIRRVPLNGRLDQQRYRYTRWDPNPLAGFQLSLEEVQHELARRYFAWTGPSSLAGFQWFSALSAKAAKAAIAPLGLVPLAPGDDRMMFPQDREALQAFEIPRQPQYELVSSLDGISLLRRDLNSLLDPRDRQRVVPSEKQPASASTLQDLPDHAILDRGRLMGLWAYDTATESIAWISFERAGAALREAVARTESYVRTELSDARSFSLDSPKSRAPRIAALRAWKG